MDHYVRLGYISTPRALKDSLNLGQPTALVQSTRAVGFPRFELPLSARGVVKCSLTKRKSIVITTAATGPIPYFVFFLHEQSLANF